jgi:hypothetical protein
MRVNHCGDHALWFIQQVIHQAREHANRSAVNLNNVGINVDSPTKDSYITIDIHTTIFNQVLAYTTRTKPGSRKYFLQTLTISKTSIVCYLFP